MYSQREQEARQRVLAEQQRLERESRFQKEEAERQERKRYNFETDSRLANCDISAIKWEDHLHFEYCNSKLCISTFFLWKKWILSFIKYALIDQEWQ